MKDLWLTLHSSTNSSLFGIHDNYVTSSCPCPRRKQYGNDHHQISIDGQSVECVNETKFLGIVLDNKMIFKPHIDHVANKLAKGIGILHRAKHTLYSKYLRTLYCALIQPYLSYCITIWGHTYNTYVSKIQLLLKKIVRIISNSEYKAHTEPLFKSLKIMTFNQLYEYFVSIFVYKSVNGELPNIISGYFQHNDPRRFSQNLRPGIHTKKYVNSI